MKKIDALIKSLSKFPKDMWWFDTCVIIQENDLSTLEHNFWFKLNPDYRYFLKKYNWISIPFEYIFWITGRSHDDIYINKERLLNIPDFLIPFSPNWRWDYYCFNKKDNKVYFWQHDFSKNLESSDTDSSSFTEWLSDRLNEGLESIGS